MNELQNEIEKFYDNYQGATDNRTEEEKLKDFNQNEIVASANPVIWVEKTDKDWRTFPALNQNFTSKCVAFTTAKLALINYWLKTKEFLKFSPNSIYDYRTNKPTGGMVGDDAFKIWQEKGIALEAVAKSDQVQENEPIIISNFAKEVAKGFILGNYITIDNGDFDRVASTIQTTNKGVMCWFYFTSDEWGKLIPTINNPALSQYSASRHSVTAVDCGLKNGKQVIRFEDSAHFGGFTEHFIDREFFNARNFLIKYPMNFNYEEAPLPPVIQQITKTLRLGMKDPEVKILQTILQTKGFYPTNIKTDTIFGNITKQAVIKFQLANGLVGDGVVGIITREKLLNL